MSRHRLERLVTDEAFERLPRWAGFVLGVASLVVGAFLALRPFSSLAVLLLGIVAALLVSAVVDLAVVTSGASSPGRLRLLTQALLKLAAGAALLLWPAPGLGVITAIAAVTLAATGVMEIAKGARARGVDRWVTVLVGTASALLGALAFAWPDAAILVLAAVFGVRLVLLGWQLLTGARRLHDKEPVRARPWLRLGSSVLGLLGALVLVAVSLLMGRAAPRPDDFYAAPVTVPAEPGRLLRSEPFTRTVPGGATAHRILYTTTRDDGVPAIASGIVVTPAVASGPTPVIAWAHGTTGWAPGCAPSVLDEPFESGALFILDQVVERGWSLVMTDYVGLGTSSPHPYLIGQGEGRSVLDALRAARELPAVALAEDTVIWGHSQGGHAALWAGSLAPTYAPELTIAGVAALAPASNLPALVEVIGTITGGSLFAAYVVQAYTDNYPDVRFDDYVRPGARVIVREMAQRCLSEPSMLVSLIGSLVLDKPIWHADPASGPLAERLRENIPAGVIPAPLLIGQGAADTLILAEAQDAFVAERCAAGGSVDYRTYDGRDHIALVEPDSPAVTDLLQWTAARFAGGEIATGCG